MRSHFEDAWNKRNLAVLDQQYSPQYVNHNPFVPDMPTGPEGVRVVIQTVTTAFPDLHMTIDD